MLGAYGGSKKLVTPVFLERSGKEYRGLSNANGEVGKGITSLQGKGGLPVKNIAKRVSAMDAYPSPKTTLCFGVNMLTFLENLSTFSLKPRYVF